MKNKSLIVIILCFVALITKAQPENVVWTTPSKNSSESMPCGGGSIGINVWVEDGDIMFYLCRSGSFDENNTLLKQGRFRIRLTPSLQTGNQFRQILNLYDGYVVIRDGKSEICLWADVFKPVVHIELNSRQKVKAELYYESWRVKDRLIGKDESFQTSYKFGVPEGTVTHRDSIIPSSNSITFYHANSAHTVFDTTVAQQDLSDYKSTMYNPLGNLIFGGRLSGDGIVFKGMETGVYDNTDYTSWKFSTRNDVRQMHCQIALACVQDDNVKWNRQLQAIERSIQLQKDRKASRNWWNAFWKRSFIESDGESKEYTRNYTLFRYMLGCNAYGEWPTKFNGGLFCFDPSYVIRDFQFTPDYRRWGGGTHTAQNQRLLYWTMLKSGDTDMMKPQLDFYLRILKNAELRSRHYWGHEGACFTEQIENFGLPEYDEYGKLRPDYFDKGLQYNAWLEYTWDTILEFCEMAFESERYAKKDISAYIPLVCSSLDFFDQHYRYLARMRGIKETDENGNLILYPGSGAETFKMAYNATSTIAGLMTVTNSLIEYLDKHHADSSLIKKYTDFKRTIPPISYRTVEGHTVLSPAVVWARVNGSEPTMLYPVYPWRMFGVGRPNLQIALDTWNYDPYVKKFNGYESWEQTNIWAACLGQTEVAADYLKKKLGNGPHRFPAFWGPGHDWTPDHNWGGSGMIGLQEMLMQEVDNRIILFPAWPKNWNVHFKLCAKNQTTVEAILKDGQVTLLEVLPSERKKDIELMLGN